MEIKKMKTKKEIQSDEILSSLKDEEDFVEVVRVNLRQPTKEETDNFNEISESGDWQKFNFSFLRKDDNEEKHNSDIVKIRSPDKKFEVRVECINGVLSIVNHNGFLIKENEESVILKNVR